MGRGGARERGVFPFCVPPYIFGRVIQFVIPYHCHDHHFDDAIGEQLYGNAFRLATVPIGLDQVSAGGCHLQIGGQSKFGRRCGDGPAQQVGLAGGRVDVNFPKHRGSFWP